MAERLAAGMNAPGFTYDTVSERALDFRETTRDKRSALFFLRYAGCPICQMKIGELRRDHDAFTAAGIKVFVVLQSDPATVKEGLAGSTLPFEIICDPAGKLFALYGVAPGNLFQYLAPPVILKALRAARGGFSHGKKEGNEMQLPAVFVVDAGGIIRYAYYGKNIGDVPDSAAVLGTAGA